MAAKLNLVQKIVGFLAYGLSFVILLFVCIWMGHFRGGFAWSSNINDGDPTLMFNLHPVMMIVGLLLFPTQAVLVFRLMPMEKFKGTQQHNKHVKMYNEESILMESY